MGRQQYYPRPVMRGAGRRGRRPGRRATFQRSVASASKKARLGYSGARGARRYGGRRASGLAYRRECLMGTHPEKKFFDFSVGATPTATGSVVYLPTLAQGASDSERVGRKAIVTDILMKGHISFGATTGAAPVTSNRVKYLVVQDTQPNGALMTAAQLFGSAADINSYMKLINAQRFKVLLSRTITCNGDAGHGDGTTNDYGGTFVPVNINLKTCIDMEYDEDVGTSGTIDEATTNAIYLVLFEEAASPATIFHVQIRLRFVE